MTLAEDAVPTFWDAITGQRCVITKEREEGGVLTAYHLINLSVLFLKFEM